VLGGLPRPATQPADQRLPDLRGHSDPDCAGERERFHVVVGLRYHGEIQPEQKVLINGAAGGVGTFAVQIAKAYGPEVTAVTSTGNLDLARSVGADHIIDYTTTDFAASGQRYDLILDTVGNRSVPDLRKALAAGGKAAVTGFTSVRGLLGVSLRGGKDIAQVQAHVTTRDLETLS